jgi:hypothetical protein
MFLFGWKEIVNFFSLSVIIFMITGCDRASLQSLQKAVIPSPLPTEDLIQVNFCTDPAQPVNSKLKYLIILDHSGSNQSNYQMSPDGTGAPLLDASGLPIVSAKYATDPTGRTRYGNVNAPGTLLNFLSTAPANDPANPTRFYSLIGFNSTATSFPADGTFTSDAQSLYGELAKESANNTVTLDDGNTSYISALTAAYNTIHGDVVLAQNCAQLPVSSASPGSWCPKPGVQASSSYIIVFMSDGAPITKISGIGLKNGVIVSTGPLVITRESNNNILGQVASLTALQANTAYVDSVNLFTVYYYSEGNIDTAGQSLLNQMAQTGNGVSYSTLTNTNIDYSRFTPPGKLVKSTLSDIFVTNASTVWWKDGQLHLDSDMDGLPDDIEKTLGTDAFNTDSDGNGVSDFVEYQLNGKPCNALDVSGRCTAIGAINYLSKLCAGISYQTLATPINPNARPLNNAIQFKSSDPSGLNDCEKKLLGDVGGIDNPDSNGDLIPDWLEFKNGVAFQLGSGSAATVLDTDNYSLYQKIKLSLPASIPYGQILNPLPTTYKLNQVSTAPVQDCYHLSIGKMQTIGSGNTIRVDVLMTNPLVQNSLIYRVAKKTLSGSTKSLQINDWKDPIEKGLGTWSSWP